MPIPLRMKKPRAPRQATPLPPPTSRHPAKGGILLKLSSDLEAAAGDKGARGVGQISSLCSQRFLGADLGERLRQEGAVLLDCRPLSRQHLQDVSSP